MFKVIGSRLFAGCLLILGVALAGCGGAVTENTGSSGGGGGGGGGPPATGTYTVSWDAVSDPDVTGYRVYFSTTPLTSGGNPRYLDIGISATSVDISPGSYGVAAGSTWYVAVASTGQGGLISPLSSETSIVVE